MGLLDVLAQYQQRPNQPPPQVLDHFDQVASQASADDLAPGLEDAFNAEETPPFEQMVGQLYERSDDHTRAGLVNEILGSLGGGRGLGGAMAGGGLGGILGDLIRRRQGRAEITPHDARGIPSSEIEEAAAQARQQNPNVIQTVSRFYAQHPQLVQMLGQTALSILMSGMARRRRM